jgi:hypothetical protein
MTDFFSGAREGMVNGFRYGGIQIDPDVPSAQPSNELLSHRDGLRFIGLDDNPDSVQHPKLLFRDRGFYGARVARRENTGKIKDPRSKIKRPARGHYSWILISWTLESQIPYF